MIATFVKSPFYCADIRARGLGGGDGIITPEA